MKMELQAGGKPQDDRGCREGHFQFNFISTAENYNNSCLKLLYTVRSRSYSNTEETENPTVT